MVGATQDTTDWDLASVRYNTDGSLHTGYGSSGKKVHDQVSGSDDIFWDVALDSAVRVVGVGQGKAESGSGTDVVVVRYNTDGSTDNNFGSSGVKVWSWTGSTNNEVGRSIAIQNNGKIVIAGDRDDDFAVARLLTNGELDTTFSSNGMNTTTIDSGVDVATGIAVSGNGYALTAGRYNNGSNLDLAVARWDVNGAKKGGGALDALFSTDGKVTQSSADTADIADSATGGVATYSDGTIIAAGFCGLTSGSNQDMCLMRFKPNGTLDTNFDSDGIRRMSYAPAMPMTDAAYGVAIQSDGKIVMGGIFADSTNTGYGISRFLTNGALDTTFDSDGYKTEAATPPESYRALHLQTDGRILLADDGNNDFKVVRFNTDGSLDSNFGTSGKFTFNGSNTDVGYGVVTMTNGKIVVAGMSNSDFSLALILTNGSLDTSFGSSGIKTHTYVDSGTDTLFSVTLQRDGKIVAGGQGKKTTGGDDVG